MMEYFDVLDENGTPTGEVKARNLVHRDGDWHRTVHVWLLNQNGELLMQLRGPNQEANPNCWDISCAGHIDAGECKEVAAKRELSEELGLILSEERFHHLFTCQSEFFDDGLIDREFSEVFLIHWNDKDGDFKLCPSEVSEVRWMPWKELEGKIRSGEPDLVQHAQEYEMLFDVLKAGHTSS
jgi:8-oxo-dGTP diphosphatase